MPRYSGPSDPLFDGWSPGPTTPSIFTPLCVLSPAEGRPIFSNLPGASARSSAPTPSCLILCSQARSVCSSSSVYSHLPTPTRPAAPSTQSSRSRTPSPRSPAPASPVSVPFHHRAEARPWVSLASSAWVPGGRTLAAPPPRPISSFSLGVFLGFPCFCLCAGRGSSLHHSPVLSDL